MTTGVAGGEVLTRLRELVAAEGGELAAALIDEPVLEVFGPLVAGSERCRAHHREYALLVESILEGYLVHYGRPRLIEPSDENLRLLAGDYLYALGLSRLAALGDIAAVRELADVIALCAEAHSGPELRSSAVPAAVWALGVLGVAGGPWDEARAAKQGLRDQRREAPAAALEAALRRAAELGIQPEAERALIAFKASS